MNGHATCERKVFGFPPLCGQPVVAHVVPGSDDPTWYACQEHTDAIRATGGKTYSEADDRAIVAS